MVIHHRVAAWVRSATNSSAALMLALLCGLLFTDVASATGLAAPPLPVPQNIVATVQMATRDPIIAGSAGGAEYEIQVTKGNAGPSATVQCRLSNPVTSHLECRGDVGITKVGPATIDYAVGATNGFDYHLTVSNLGRSPLVAGSMTITDLLPAGLAFEGNLDGGTCAFSSAAQGSGPLVIRNGAALPAGSSCDVVMHVRINAPDATVCRTNTLYNVAQVSTRGGSRAQASWLSTVACDTTLTVTKTALDPFIVGTTVRFDIIVRNSGSAPALDVTLTDKANLLDSYSASRARLAGMNIIGSPGVGDCTDDGLCRIGDIGPGQEVRVRSLVELPSDVKSLQLSQEACAVADNAGMACDRVIGPVSRQTKLHLITDGQGRSVMAGGDPLQYVITVWNDGPSDAYSVTVQDTPMAGFYLVDGLQPGDWPMDCHQDECEIPLLKAGQSMNINATVRAGANAAPGMNEPANVACIVPHEENEQKPICAIANTMVVTDADLWLQKSAPPTADAGERIVYTLRVYNNGPSNAGAGSAVDTLPAGAKPATWDPACSSTPGNVISCDFSGLAAGAWSTFAITATVDSDVEPGSSLQNLATVKSATPDSNPANNIGSADTSVVNLADLALTKVGPASVTAGATAVFVLIVKNNGPSTAQSVDIKDALPDGLSLVNATATRSGAGLAHCAGTMCQAGNMAVAEVVTVTVTARVDPNLAAGTLLTNTATVFAVTPDTTPADNTVSVISTVTVQVDLDVDKVAMKGYVGPTEGFVYDLAVTNLGPSAAQNVVVVDTLGIDQLLDSINPAAGCTANGSSITCTIDSLPAGSTVHYWLAVVAGDVADGTVLSNQAVATTTTPEVVVDNNIAHAQTVVRRAAGPTADLLVTKRATASAVTAGGIAGFAVTVQNNGPTLATSVQLFDQIPGKTRIAGMSAANPDFEAPVCTLGGICYLGILKPGSVATVHIDLKAGADFDGAILANTVVAAAAEVDPDVANNVSTATMMVEPSPPNLVVEQTTVTPQAMAGEEVEFQVAVKNAGGIPLTGVAATFVLPHGLIYVSDSAGCDPDTALCILGDLQPLEARTFTLRTAIDPVATCGAILTSLVTGSATNLAAGKATAESPVQIQCQADLRVTLVELELPPADDDAIGVVQRYIVENLGPSPANGVTLKINLLGADLFEIWHIKADVLDQHPGAVCESTLSSEPSAGQTQYNLMCTLPVALEATAGLVASHTFMPVDATPDELMANTGTTGRWMVDVELHAAHDMLVTALAKVTGATGELMQLNNTEVGLSRLVFVAGQNPTGEKLVGEPAGTANHVYLPVVGR